MTSSVAGAVIIGLCSYCLPIGSVQGCHAVTAPKPSSHVPTPIDSPEGDTEIDESQNSLGDKSPHTQHVESEKQSDIIPLDASEEIAKSETQHDEFYETQLDLTAEHNTQPPDTVGEILIPDTQDDSSFPDTQPSVFDSLPNIS